MPVTSLRKACVRPPEVAKLRAAPALTQLSLAGFGASLLISNNNIDLAAAANHRLAICNESSRIFSKDAARRANTAGFAYSNSTCKLSMIPR